MPLPEVPILKPDGSMRDGSLDHLSELDRMKSVVAQHYVEHAYMIQNGILGTPIGDNLSVETKQRAIDDLWSKIEAVWNTSPSDPEALEKLELEFIKVENSKRNTQRAAA